MSVIQLSPLMQEAVSNWQRLGHKTDIKLLFECAYYPRAGCQFCSYSQPNHKCKYAHILTLTTSLNYQKMASSVQQSRVKTREQKIAAMEKYLEGIPDRVKVAVRAVLEKEIK